MRIYKFNSKNTAIIIAAFVAIGLMSSAIVFADGDPGGDSGGPAGVSANCGCSGTQGTGTDYCGNSDPNQGGDGIASGNPFDPNPGTPGNPSCNTFSCISAANICGDVNTGSQSSCGGGCSASVPANPSGTCEVATLCGVNATGFNGCSGSCNITRYPFCKTVANPYGDGEIEWVTIGDGDGNGGNGYGATDIVAEIFARPILVVQGSQTIIRWLSTETESCTVTAPNGDSWTGTEGEELSGDIEEETPYTLTCIGYDDSTVVDTVVVRVAPDWQEF